MKRAALLGLLVMAGCTTQTVAVKPTYDFSKIRRITVMPFEGQGGAAASEEFVRQFVATGLEVTDARHPGDVLLRGTVTEYKPNNQLMVFLGNTTLATAGDKAVVVENPIVSQIGPQATPDGASSGARHAQILSVAASVGINAHLIDRSSKTVLWAGSLVYESLDVQTALRAVAESFRKSLERIIPQMTKQTS